MSVYEIMPGIKLAILCEYSIVGEIGRPDYTSNTTELSITLAISGVTVKLISRMYECEDTAHTRPRSNSTMASPTWTSGWSYSRC